MTYLEPMMDADSAPFWEGCLAGELRIQRCADTGRLMFPPRPRSPWGTHRPPEWVTVSGRGTVWSYVVPHPPLLPEFAEAAPYNVIVVALEEDPTIRLVGNLVEGPDGAINAIDPTTIRVGEPVRVVFDAPRGTIAMPRWVRVG